MVTIMVCDQLCRIPQTSGGNAAKADDQILGRRALLLQTWLMVTR